MVLEKVCGIPYPQIIQTHILDPLGMKNSVPVLSYAVQPRFARAYMPRCDDRPNRLDADLTPVPWIESATGDGCISSNAEDLVIYTRMLLNRGMGDAGRILSEESFDKMTLAYQQRTEERAYGYGPWRCGSRMGSNTLGTAVTSPATWLSCAWIRSMGWVR